MARSLQVKILHKLDIKFPDSEPDEGGSGEGRVGQEVGQELGGGQGRG